MDETENYFKGSVVSAWIRSWNHFHIVPRVYADTADTHVLISEIKADEKNNNVTLQEAAKETIVKNSDENLKQKLEDPQLLAEVEIDVKEHMIKETGWDRLTNIYRREKSDELSPELTLTSSVVTNTAGMTFVACSIFGGLAAAQKFVEKNQHTPFDTKFVAMRRYNDAVMFGAIRFGSKMAMKTGLFAGLFMLTSQSIAAYRNKSSLLEYVAGGGVTCGLLGIGRGWRGTVSGGILGSAFGLFGGLITLALFKVTGLTQEERHRQALIEFYVQKREFHELPSESPESQPLSIQAQGKVTA